MESLSIRLNLFLDQFIIQKKMQNHQIILVQRPVGMVKNEDMALQISESPELEEGQIRIQNEYISLDPAIRGWMNAGTTYIAGIPIGGVVRAFAAGRVIESKNPEWSVGQAVEGLLHAQSLAVSEGKGLAKIDENIGSLSAHLGILGMPGMTAYFGLFDRGKPQPGETVLISGAAGIIGTLVGQMAKISGCRVVGIAGGPEKCQTLLDFGFDAAIDYKNEDIDTGIKKHCPEGVHIFYDNVGGEQLDFALQNLARGARVIICGAISQYNNTGPVLGPKNYMKIVTARGEMKGIIVFDYIDQYPKARQQMAQWMQSGQLQFQEHILAGLDNFASALLMLFEGKNKGKLLIKI
jgi:NADPH-dependent curcumin reductase